MHRIKLHSAETLVQNTLLNIPYGLVKGEIHWVKPCVTALDDTNPSDATGYSISSKMPLKPYNSQYLYRPTKSENMSVFNVQQSFNRSKTQKIQRPTATFNRLQTEFNLINLLCAIQRKFKKELLKFLPFSNWSYNLVKLVIFRHLLSVAVKKECVRHSSNRLQV